MPILKLKTINKNWADYIQQTSVTIVEYVYLTSFVCTDNVYFSTVLLFFICL